MKRPPPLLPERITPHNVKGRKRTMKKITPYHVVYGRDATHLALTKKAESFYSGTDPISIYEIETDDGYRYSYALCGEYINAMMTADELNEMLEELSDEIEGSV